MIRKGPTREPAPDPRQDEPLRDPSGDWSPLRAIDELGPAINEGEQLAHLLTAFALLVGPQKVHVLATRLDVEAARLRPRIEAMPKDRSLVQVAPVLNEIVLSLAEALLHLPAIKARAANDQGGKPAGLKVSDPQTLARATNAVIRSLEAANKPNPAGVNRALKFLARTPSQLDVPSWAQRLLPGPNAGFRWATPPELGRVVILSAEGRIAYDPVAPPMERP